MNASGIDAPVDTTALVDALVSHAQALGIFDSVNGHEPRSAPGHGLTYSIWFQTVRPFAPHSGLAATSAALIYTARIYFPMPLANPATARGYELDAVDPRLADAAIALIASYSRDFTLDGLISHIDLLGRTGVQFGLGGEAGYLEQDRTLFRVLTLTIPLVVNDVFVQAP